MKPLYIIAFAVLMFTLFSDIQVNYSTGLYRIFKPLTLEQELFQ